MSARPTFRRVLVAVDGSAHSDLALAMAIALAERDNARLAVLTVIPNAGESAAALAYGAPVDPVAMQRDADRGAEQTMREAIDAVPDDQPVDSVTRRGNAATQIVAQVKEGNHDAVIVGARGLGRIGSMVGSVSRYVLHHAGVAVFVAHAPRD
ncbi:MAG: universal stress protein [Conexibacter sp.]|nr:universal stress protein [Conexibacter sp.]